MRKLILLFLTIIVVAVPVMATEVWNGPMINFTRPDNVDGSNPANMDQITPNVWITRNTGGGSIWNFQVPGDNPYNCSGPAPTDTEWALGDIANYAVLDYGPFLSIKYADCAPIAVAILGPGVVHLISEDIYIPIQFVSWTAGGAGGFSYNRGTAPPVPTAETTWGGIKALYK